MKYSINRNNYSLKNIQEEINYLEKTLRVLEDKESELEAYKFVIDELKITRPKVYDLIQTKIDNYNSIPF